MTSQKSETSNWICGSDRRGFFTTQFLMVMVLFSVVLFCYGFILYAIQRQDHFRETCLTKGVAIQKTLIQYEKQLFTLNALSTTLRWQLIYYTAQKAAALFTYNAPAAAMYAVKIQNTIARQNRLDRVQKGLIQAAKWQTRFLMAKLAASFFQHNLNENKNWNEYLNTGTNFQFADEPVLSVEPDSLGGTAPNYVLQNDYQTKQRLAFKWHFSFITKLLAQSTLSTSQMFEQHCQVYPAKKGDTWDVKINLDKYSSKPWPFF